MGNERGIKTFSNDGRLRVVDKDLPKRMAKISFLKKKRNNKRWKLGASSRKKDKKAKGE